MSVTSPLHHHLRLADVSLALAIRRLGRRPRHPFERGRAEDLVRALHVFSLEGLAGGLVLALVYICVCAYIYIYIHVYV